jgi:hypothetical protein
MVLSSINIKNHNMQSSCNQFWGFHNCVTEDSGLLGCAAVSAGEWFLKFWRNILPPFSRVRWTKKFFLVQLTQPVMLCYIPENRNPRYKQIIMERLNFDPL